MMHPFSVDAAQQQRPAAAPAPLRSFGLGALAGVAGAGLVLVAVSCGGLLGPGRAAKFLGGAAPPPQLGRGAPAISPQRSRVARAELSMVDTPSELGESLSRRVKIFQDSRAAGASNKQAIASVVAGEYDEESVKAEMSALIGSAPAVMFTWEFCPSCKKAVAAFEEAGADVKIVRLDDPWSKGNPLRAELGKMAGRSSVPLIFLGGRYVGGFDGGVSEEAPGIQSMAFKGTLLPTLAAIGAMKPKVPLAAETPAPETTAAPETTPAAKEDDVPPPPPDVLPPPPPAP